MRRVFTCLAAASAALVLIPFAPAGATARTTDGFGDQRGDSVHGIDIKSTTFDTKTPGYLRFRVFGYEFVQGRLNSVRLYIDTKPRDAGPDFRIAWGLPNDGVWQNPSSPMYDGNDYKASLLGVDSWDSPGRRRECVGIRLSVDYRSDVVTVAIPKRCLGHPSRLRWAFETERVTRTEPDGTYWYKSDATPGRFRFLPYWTHVSP